MTEKEDFIERFKRETGKNASDFTGNPKGFADALNKGSGGLRKSFRAAVDEATPSEEDAARGLAQLFGTP